MRVSGLRGTPRGPNGHKDLEPREAARAVKETMSPEPVDEQIESLLLSLGEQAEPVMAEEQHSARRSGRAVSKRRRHHRRHRVNQFDLFVVVTAVVLGFAVGLLTVVLVNG
jgi:hypothetical protein